MAEDGFGRAIECLVPADEDGVLPLLTVRPGGLDAALAGLAEGFAGLLPGAAGFVRASGFAGQAGQVCLVPGGAGGGPGGGSGLAGAVLGVGEDRSPWAHAGLALGLPEGTAWRLLPGDFDAEAAGLGFVLGAYHYGRLQRPKRAPARLVASDLTAAARAAAEAIWLARDLVNTPANLLGPAALAQATVALGERHGAQTEVVSGEALAARYPAIAAVGQGSARAPAVAVLHWTGPGADAGSPLISLCGKGVCFDSGGYDLKPAAGMLRMKKDMGGAAALLGLAHAVMALGLTVRLAVRVGCVENMVSGAAMRPLDVIRTRLGLAVEVGNTDAEGRLVLCDLLAEAAEEQPSALIDAATLTGAARVALGPDLPAVFTPDDAAAAALMRLGAAAHDPVWRLPLFGEYDQWLASGVADLNNVSSKPHAGAIIAALFLKRFVPDGVRWIHIDTYAWNDSARPGRPEGGEAQAVRALLAYCREITF